MYIIPITNFDKKIPYKNFKAISIDSKYTKGLQNTPSSIIEKGENTITTLSTETILEKLEKLANEEKLIKQEMEIRRQLESEKKWYQKTDYYKLDILENIKLEKIKEQRNALVKTLIDNSNISEKTVLNTIDELKDFADKQKKLQSKLKELSPLLNADAELSKNKGFDSIAGYQQEKDILHKFFINKIKKEQIGEKVTVPGAILFFGPTGNGKTAFAKAFAEESKCKFVSIQMNPFCRKDIADKNFYSDLLNAAQKSEKIFKETSVRTILFIDEIINIIDQQSTILPLIIKFLEECSEKYHCTIFAATNHPLQIALPIEEIHSKFPYIVALDPPNMENKAEILKYYLNPRINTKVNFSNLASSIERIENNYQENFSISQIKEEICKKIIKKDISEEEIIKLISKVKPNITKEALLKYKKEIKLLMKNII